MPKVGAFGSSFASTTLEGLGFDSNHRRDTNIFPTTEGSANGNYADLAFGNEQIATLNVGKLITGTIYSRQITLAVTPDEGDTFLAAGKTDFNDTTAGFILGIDDSDSDSPKFAIGDATTSMDWNVTVANTLTIVGAITATTGAIGGFDIGTDYIRDVANSFGLASTVTAGDDVRFWSGATFANRATAPARITEAGASTFTSITLSTSVVLSGLQVGSDVDGQYLTALSVTAASIANATITGGKIASATITATNITAATITATEIANATITGGKIASGTITATNITAGTITSTEIASATILGSNIAVGTITGSNILDATITGADIASATIAGGNIASATITGSNIASATITGSNIASATITATNITAGTITSTEIASGTITGDDIAAATITGSNIAATTITATNITALTITAAEIANLTINGAKITAASITPIKTSVPIFMVSAGTFSDNTPGAGSVAWSSVTIQYEGTENTIVNGNTASRYLIWDSAVPTALSGSATVPTVATQWLIGLNNSGTFLRTWDMPQIHGEQIQAATITGNEIGSATITATNITAGTITATQIAAGTITATEIASATITGANIASGTITGDNILDATITGADIASATITATNIANATITTTQISATAGITGGQIANTTISATNITNATITTTQISNTAGITGTQIANTTIAAANIVNATITTTQIASATITGSNIDSATITGSNIAATTITATNITALTITAAEIADLTISTGKVAALAITNAKIADLAVSKLTAGTITSKSIVLAVTPAGGDTEIRAGIATGDFANTGAASGFILGIDDSDSDLAKLYIGGPTTFLNWDGAGLTISGGLTTTAGSVINASYLTGALSSAVLNLADRGWTQTSAFSVTDADTVAWGIGTFTSSDGTAYSIGAGNTGNMIARTYIYLDIAVSTIAYQTTTTASTAVGAGKVLVATAVNGTNEATFQVFNGIGGLNISGLDIALLSITAGEIANTTITAGKIVSGTITTTQIAANTIVAGNIAAGTITTTEIAANTIVAGNIAAGTITTTQIAATTIVGGNINTLSIAGKSVTMDTGTIGGWTLAAGTLSSGSVTISATAERILMGAATAPLTGIGVFLGLDVADYEFRVGNPAAEFMHWDGTNLTITGQTINATTLEIGGAGITATPAEINQALDGISANVTDTNLNTLTAGTTSEASALHKHIKTHGQGTRTTAEGTGTETIAHGLGVAPKLFKITYFQAPGGGSGTGEVASWGVGTCIDTTDEISTWVSINSTTSTNDAGQTSGQIIHTQRAGTGATEWEASVTTVDATNVILTFGTASADRTLYYQWEAFS